MNVNSTEVCRRVLIHLLSVIHSTITIRPIIEPRTVNLADKYQSDNTTDGCVAFAK